MRRVFLLLVCSATILLPASLEETAVSTENRILAKHLPVGSLLDPIFDGPDVDTIKGYTRCGDSALWTGVWLAGESYHFRVAPNAVVLDRIRSALAAIERLNSVTGGGSLARCAIPVSWQYAAGIRAEEAGNNEHSTTINGEQWVWFGHTSRDQYIGVLFGLSTAYQHVEDAQIRARIAVVATNLIDGLIQNAWNVQPPGESVSTTFAFRPDQEAAILQIGKQVNPSRYTSAYDNFQAGLLGFNVGLTLDALDPNSSYFKFNLDEMTLERLIKLEPANSSRLSDYWNSYQLIHRTVATHKNAFFNLVDRAIAGPDGKRDAETVQYLNDWTTRPIRDFFVDLRGKVTQCSDDRACDPIPVSQRVLSDYLWQRSPFQLSGGGTGRVENAGLDFVLPYWMARYYAVTSPIALVSAAAGGYGVAAASIASAYGTGLGNVSSVEVLDAGGATAKALIFAVTPSQVNFQIPERATVGSSAVTFVNTDGTRLNASVSINQVAPTLFSATQDGQGPAAANYLRNGVTAPVSKCFGPLLCSMDTLRVGDWLSLFGTGVRNRTSLANVQVLMNGRAVAPAYAGAQGQFAGLDQINVQIPPSLGGSGDFDVALLVDGVKSNSVRVRVQ